jgi:sodium/hydrogen exchanger-like protein 6/7
MSPLTYLANKHQLFHLSTGDSKEALNFSILEILLFCSVISSTDAVAALTFIKEDEEPKLFEILFGEAVINDAVCIVLYTIIVEFFKSGQEFNSKTPIKMMGSFTYIFIFSVIIGAVIACLSALFIKKVKDLQVELNRMQECSIIILFAFTSYYLTEALELSPIIALLFCGIFMSQYTFYNLSFQAREESAVVSKVMSSFGEGYVFVFLGLSVNPAMAFSFSFFTWELIFLIGGRIFVVYGISFFMELLKVRSFNLLNSTKGIMTCSGWIRGAIAFGLAISISTTNELNK